MRRLIGAASRRTAGMAAGLILTGGVVGGVLLAPGAAYADTGTTVAITGATQDQGFDGGAATLDVGVSVQPAPTSPTWVAVSGAGDGCTAFVGASGTGDCAIRDVAAGTYTLTASSGGSTSAGFPVTVTGAPTTPAPTGSAPVFSADSPSTSVDGQSYSYDFQASGSPSYSLAGAPYWLNIDASSGMVSGTIPDGTTSFSYSVEAQNSYGSASAGPFTVYVQHDYYRHRHHHHEFANLSTSLSCTSPVHTGQRGHCTLDVTNDGYSSASDVTAQITLPYQLRADYCGYYNWYRYGCDISGHTASEDLGTLNAGQTEDLTVTFTADSGYTLWGRHHGHRFTVPVNGSASSFGDYGTYSYYGQRESSSTAYVTVIPRGFWW